MTTTKKKNQDREKEKNQISVVEKRNLNKAIRKKQRDRHVLILSYTVSTQATSKAALKPLLLAHP